MIYRPGYREKNYRAEMDAIGCTLRDISSPLLALAEKRTQEGMGIRATGSNDIFLQAEPKFSHLIKGRNRA